jgi:hemerythrin
MGIQWRDSLSIGIEEIDNQHKELLQRFNDLLAACESGKGREELVSLIGFLDEYVRNHFRDEEAIQRVRGYPAYESHKAEHDFFIVQLKALKEEIGKEGVATHHVLEANNLLLNWLLKHISKIDTELGKFLRSQTPQQQS